MLGNICVDVMFKDIKNLHLSVNPPTGKVRISAPYRMSLETVRIFAITKLAWIKRHQTKFLKQEREAPREYVNRESHYFRGMRYLLNVNYHNAPPRVEIRNKARIDLYIREGSGLEHKKRAMTEWYRGQLKDRIPPLIEKWQRVMGVEVKDWRIKRMKTRWGTCSIKPRRIWINLELAKKPDHCLEYIIVHEMVHLLERKHSNKFIAYMNKFLPQWREYKQELNRFILNHAEWDY
jgi:predicted metal-dependent hydrolase